MKVVVTGAGGFLGARLVRQLVEDGAEVVAVVRPGSPRWRIEDVADDVELVEADLTRDVGELEGLARGSVDVVYHLAAAGVDPRGGDGLDLVEQNVGQTVRVLELATALDAGRLVYAGSCFEYAPGERIPEHAAPAPRTTYAAAKSAAWIVVHAYQRQIGLPVVTLRPFTLYGPFESAYRLVASATLSALAGRPIEITNGEQSRDFVHVNDAAAAFVAAATNGVPGGTYNVCTGISTRVVDVARTIARLTGERSEVHAGAIPSRRVEFMHLSGDPSAAARDLRWQAGTSLEDGLAETIEWFSERGARLPEYAEATV